MHRVLSGVARLAFWFPPAPARHGSSASACSPSRSPGGEGPRGPLISDPEHGIAEAYGGWKEKSLYGRKFMGIVRSTFVMDEKGEIAEIYSKVRVKDHVRSSLKTL